MDSRITGVARATQSINHSCSSTLNAVIGLCRIWDLNKGATTTTLPQQQHLIALWTAQLCGTVAEQAQDHRTIIIGQLDQAGLCNKSAELDQMPGSFAALHNPVARIIAASYRQQPMLGRHRAPLRRSRCGQLCEQIHVFGFERRRLPDGAIPPGSRRPSCRPPTATRRRVPRSTTRRRWSR